MLNMSFQDQFDLDTLAELQGGYVAPPWSLIPNPDGEAKFSAIRQYSLKYRKPISKFTDEDYAAIDM